jgi:hypothetical protein
MMAVVWMAMTFISGSWVVLWVFYGAIFLVIIYTLQAAALEGDGAPHLPMSKWSALGLSFALAFFDALMTYAWYAVLKMLAKKFLFHTVYWADEILIVGILGFLVGFVINSLSGFYLPRYTYLRLLLVGHFIGLLMLLLPIFCVSLAGWEIAADIRNHWETLAAFGLAGCVLLALWGIAPAGYLIAYRRYTRRLHLPASGLADEGEMD